VPQDYVQAYLWFALAGELNNRDLAASRMTAEQIAEAKRLVQEWKPKRE
jgi:TPR repeat protein